MFLSKMKRAVTSVAAAAVASTPASSSLTTLPQTVIAYEVFKDHWRQVLVVFNKNLISDDDIHTVKSHLAQMVNILVDELSYSTLSQHQQRKQHSKSIQQQQQQAHRSDSSWLLSLSSSYGHIWEYTLRNNLFETVFLWTLSYPEYLFELKSEQLSHYDTLVASMQMYECTDLLTQPQLCKPMFSLLNHCATHHSHAIESQMIAILNQLCLCMCNNSRLVNVCFEMATDAGSNPSDDSNNNNNGSFNDKSIRSKIAVHSPSSASRKASSSATSSGATSKFFIFSLLIPYIHREGSLGKQARDALLMIMQLSCRNASLARFIVDNTDFCPILATGLSALYSELPQKLTSDQASVWPSSSSSDATTTTTTSTGTSYIGELRYLQRVDLVHMQALNKFINSLEFCNNVIQVSHSLIANQLLQFVYYGFLVPVIATALTQNSVDEIVAATAYLELFLRTINEPNLLRIFLKFVLYFKFDDRAVLLETLLNRISSNSKLSIVTLMLFYTIIDLNSEDVMYKLVLSYLMPCNHLMRSQISTLRQSSFDTSGDNAKTFLSLATNFSSSSANDAGVVDGESAKNSSKSNTSLSHHLSESSSSLPLQKWITSNFEETEMPTIHIYYDHMTLNYADYLKDAREGIVNTSMLTASWSHSYDIELSNVAGGGGETSNGDASVVVVVQTPCADLDCGPDEYLINLNVAASSLANTVDESASTTPSAAPVIDAKASEQGGLIASDRSSAAWISRRHTTTTTTTTSSLFDFDINVSEKTNNPAPTSNNENEATSLSQINTENSTTTTETRSSALQNDQVVRRSSKKRNEEPHRRDGRITADGDDGFPSSSTLSVINNDAAFVAQTRRGAASNNEKSNSKPTERRRQKRRRDRAAAAAKSDFYVLSFDNELSETSSSSDSSSASSSPSPSPSPNTFRQEGGELEFDNDDDDDDEEEEEEEEEEEDDYNIATSVSSSATINTNSKRNSQPQQQRPQSAHANVAADEESLRRMIVERFFDESDESRACLNSTLAQFLDALDTLPPVASDPKQHTNQANTTVQQADALCAQILDVYNELFVANQNTNATPAATTRDEKEGRCDSVTSVVQTLGEKRLSTRLSTLYASNQSLPQSSNWLSTQTSTTAAQREAECIGPLLSALLNRLEHMVNNSLQVNLLVTGLLARLAYYQHLPLRSFLLNHKLVMRSNTRSLIQVLTNLKLKIDACAKSNENFPLLYTKAKLCLVKRLIDNTNMNAVPRHMSTSETSGSKSSVKSPVQKKKSTMDKLKSIFFRPSSSAHASDSASDTTTTTSPEPIDSIEINFCEEKAKFNKQVANRHSDLFQLRELHHPIDVDNEWRNDLKTRNLAFSVVIYDEFIKELAAICQEHMILTQE